MSVWPPKPRHLVSMLLALALAASLLASAALLPNAPAALDVPGGTATERPVVAPRPESAPAVSSDDTTHVARKQSPAKRKKKPNVLLITTDDQTLADLRYMPQTRRRIGNRGVRLTGLAPHPLCCPARAMMLTGQHAQNNGVRSNDGRYGGYKRLDTRRTVGSWMSRAGYRTIYLGKFLNGYSRPQVKHRTPGWRDWNASVSGVYNLNRYTVNHNGRLRTHTRYQTDYFSELAAAKIRKSARGKKPFFLWQSYVAPHSSCAPRRETRDCWRPPTAARRHRTMFGKAQPPAFTKGAYNEANVSDKPRWVRTGKKLTRADRVRIRRSHRQRLRSLRSVDEGIGAMLTALARTKQLRNTVVIFTSDNGFLLGEHREVGKLVPYEESLRVPFLIRGPGIPKGKTRNVVATHADIAPTIAAIGRVRPGRRVDGQSLLPAARRGARTYDTVLIQGGPHRKRYLRSGWFYRGVRTMRYTYAHYPRDREHELYDRARDPLQLTNVANDVRYVTVVRDLQRRLTHLKNCAGAACRKRFGTVATPAPSKPGRRAPNPYRYIDRR